MTHNAFRIVLVLLLGWVQFAHGQANIFQETFQAGFPDAWSQQATDSTSDGFRWGTSLTLSSVDFEIPDHGSFLVNNEDGCRFGGTPTCNKANEWLYMPALDLAGLEGARLYAEVFFPGGSYGGATETASVQVSSDSVSWTNIATIPGDAANWQVLMLDLSAYANDSSVYVAFTYQDDGGWPFGIALDNVLVQEVPALDLETNAVPFAEPYVLAGPKPIKAHIKNLGHDTVFSLLFHYQIDDNDPVEQLFSSLVLPPMETLLLEADQVWEAAASTETYAIDIWVSEPNGFPDESTSNDHDAVEVGVLDASQTIPRGLLVEHFTSTNSDSCAFLNPVYQAALTDAGVPVFGLSYHTWWPTPTDVFYLNNPQPSDRRVAYYDADAVPSVYVAGQAKAIRSDLLPDSMFQFAALPSPIDLEADWIQESDGTLTATITVNTLASHWMNSIRVYAAVTEAFVPGPNPDLPEYQNGESAFYDVVLDILPQPNGVALEDSTAGASTTYTWTWQPPADVALDDNLNLTVFVQDNRSRMVLQAARYSSRVSGLPALTAQTKAKLYPNPASNWANLVWDLPSAENLEITVHDATGRVHESLVSGLHAAGPQQRSIDLSEYPNGFYWVSLRGDYTALTLPLQVIR